MLVCNDLKNAFESIKNLKHELDLEMQKEERERDYSKVQAAKEKIAKEVKELDYKINPIPELLRGKEGVRIERLLIGGKTKEQLIQEMREKNISIGEDSMCMLKSEDFEISAHARFLKLIRLRVGDLGFSEGDYATTDELYKRIEELGLELCPPEVGPNYRLKYMDQPNGEWIKIGMKQIAGGDAYSSVFCVERDNDGLWLSSRWAESFDGWGRQEQVIFCLSKSLRGPADREETSGN